MYSVKSYYEIALMHLLNIIILARSVKIQRIFFVFLIAIANDREITKKKQKPDPNPNDIKTAIFYRNEKIQIVQRLLCNTMLSKQFAINNFVRASTFYFMNKQHWLKGKKCLI